MISLGAEVPWRKKNETAMIKIWQGQRSRIHRTWIVLRPLFEIRALRFREQPSVNDELPREVRIGRSLKRRLFFWLTLAFAWIIVPLLLIGALELALRAIGYGHSTRFFTKGTFRGEKPLFSNRCYYDQFFAMPVVWDSSEFVATKRKPENTYRIFVFGSSAAVGVPDPDPDFGFSRILEFSKRCCARSIRTRASRYSTLPYLAQTRT